MKRRVIAVLLVVCLVAGMVPYALAGDTPQQYKVTIEPSDHGTVTASATEANAGTVIQLTAEPEENYRLDKIAVKDSEDNEIILVPVGTNRYFFPMPASDVTVTGTFIAPERPESACPRDDTCPLAKFTDLDRKAWYHDGVHYAMENHLMVGTGSNTFEPSTTTSRAMVVTVLFRFEGEQAVGNNPFIDVPEDRWYTAAITWAAANKIIEGYGNGYFKPEDPISREEMAQILMNYAVFKGYDVSARGDLNTFADGDETSDWARRAMEWAVGEGLYQGDENNRLDPQGETLRSEFATIMMRFDANVVDKPEKTINRE